jgi:hypothetical protein
VGDEFRAREVGELVLRDGSHHAGWWPRVSSGVWGREWFFFWV